LLAKVDLISPPFPWLLLLRCWVYSPLLELGRLCDFLGPTECPRSETPSPKPRPWRLCTALLLPPSPPLPCGRIWTALLKDEVLYENQPLILSYVQPVPKNSTAHSRAKPSPWPKLAINLGWDKNHPANTLSHRHQ
jgi:hypothetical protein